MAWIQGILQSLAALMIMPTIPTLNPDGIWEGAKAWEKDGPALVYKAESEKIVELCRARPNSTISTSVLVQGGQRFLLDGEVIASPTDREFKRAGNMYSSAAVPCKRVLAGKKVTWEAFSITHSLAHLSRFPTLRDAGTNHFLEVTANVMGCGIMAVLGVLCFLIFHGKVGNDVLYPLLGSCILWSVSFACFVPDSFAIRMSPLMLQKLSDSCSWLAVACLAQLYFALGFCNRLTSRFASGTCGFAVLIILLGGNLDQSQVGSNIAYFAGNIFFVSTVFFARNLSKTEGFFANRNQILKVCSVIIFAVSGLHDTFLNQGMINSEPIFSLGVISFMMLSALAVNELIAHTYEERDYLRGNLEKEVERKTEALMKKSIELEQTLTTLKGAQAELIQSAKLAALGTLSAGIAHEINNSLNYVNGGIEPLQQILKKPEIGESERTKANKLLNLMKEGLSLTFAIIVNLKRHTSQMPGQTEMLPIREVLEGSILLLKNKLSEIEIIIDIAPELEIPTQRVSVSQIFMNLLGNAIDALHESEGKTADPDKKIHISAGVSGNDAWVSIEDNGVGMPAEIKDRVFDPFFTTKAVGKGTGLGLHIVMTEMQKQHGRVEVQSEPGKGTKFILHFPSKLEAIAA